MVTASPPAYSTISQDPFIYDHPLKIAVTSEQNMGFLKLFEF